MTDTNGKLDEHAFVWSTPSLRSTSQASLGRADALAFRITSIDPAAVNNPTWLGGVSTSRAMRRRLSLFSRCPDHELPLRRGVPVYTKGVRRRGVLVDFRQRCIRRRNLDVVQVPRVRSVR